MKKNKPLESERREEKFSLKEKLFSNKTILNQNWFPVKEKEEFSPATGRLADALRREDYRESRQILAQWGVQNPRLQTLLMSFFERELQYHLPCSDREGRA